MSKIACPADIHFGYSGRLDDTVWACRVLNAYCKDHSIDTVINLGDLTHDRKSIDIDVYCGIHDVLTEAKDAGVNWHTFLGNHDMFLRHSWEVNSAKPLSNLITVIDDVKLLHLDDRRFWVIPFIQFEKSYMKVLKEVEAMAEEGDGLLTHIGVRNSTLNTCFMIKDWSFVNFDDTKFSRIYTGHFHTHQQVGGNLWYPGSLIPFKLDEGDVPHGFIVYDTATDDHEFVDIWQAGAKYFPDSTPPPQFMTVLDEQVEGLTPQDVRGNVVRIALSRDYNGDEKAELKDVLLQLGASKVRWLQPRLKDTKVQEGFNGGNRLTTPGELFIRWLDQDKPKGVEHNLLIKLENEIRQEGDERYSYEEID